MKKDVIKTVDVIKNRDFRSFFQLGYDEGTFDEKWLIESLSDSTIYMAYYTIAHLIKDIPIEKVDDELFDYIFLSKGKKPNIKNIEKLKEEFEYWYPVDFRNSGKDLVQNHLTFFLFNHVVYEYLKLIIY